MADKHFRWIATIEYSTSHGSADVQYHFEELDELDYIIERGLDWNSLIEVRITLNLNRKLYRAEADKPDEDV